MKKHAALQAGGRPAARRSIKIRASPQAPAPGVLSAFWQQTQPVRLRLSAWRARLLTLAESHPRDAAFICCILIALVATRSGLWPIILLFPATWVLWRKSPLWPLVAGVTLLWLWGR